MRKLLSVYQYLGPAILTPLAWALWQRHYGGDNRLVLFALAVPIIHAYVVPGVGANVLGMWAFDTRLRLGRFRPHHGFVFGSATAVIALPFAGVPLVAFDPWVAAATGLAIGAVLLAVNWIYDALAIRHGMLNVYNQPAANGASPALIAADYVIWFFGLFGVIYGAGLKLAEPILGGDAGWLYTAAAILACVAATAILPSAAYVVSSYALHGHNGLRPVASAEKAPS